ncbi:MAG: hypothetical protein L0Y71_13765 [Gemmataceae bacterium]|nr:hypothetical protein [Gemmataceae bacterium]
MRRFIFAALLPCLTLGCIEMEVSLRERPSRSATPPPAIAAPITADQVTPANARRMAQALWDEFDREELTPSTTASSKTSPER